MLRVTNVHGKIVVKDEIHSTKVRSESKAKRGCKEEGWFTMERGQHCEKHTLLS